MSKDSEYEWSLYTGLEVMDTRLQDTFKRVKNLYNDIQNVLKDEKYKGNLENVYKAYKRFSSKLQKLKYENYLELQKEILFHHICDNDTYFGINIYRFEKESKLYIMINEIKCLLQCKNEAEEENVLKKSILLERIHFPKVYNDFYSLSNIEYCINSFFYFQDFIVISACLIIDELVEKGYFKQNWEQFFLNTINEMTKSVFYDPNEIDFTVSSDSQEKFMKLLSLSVRRLIFQKTGILIKQ